MSQIGDGELEGLSLFSSESFGRAETDPSSAHPAVRPVTRLSWTVAAARVPGTTLDYQVVDGNANGLLEFASESETTCRAGREFEGELDSIFEPEARPPSTSQALSVERSCLQSHLPITASILTTTPQGFHWRAAAVPWAVALAAALLLFGPSLLVIWQSTPSRSTRDETLAVRGSSDVTDSSASTGRPTSGPTSASAPARDHGIEASSEQAPPE
ncbi:MAG TPA: hypothetical protein VD833_25515 [Vicinamibacterales bacterium]|nr:hypothetical protein [Vicinamibacterales bacterium]